MTPLRSRMLEELQLRNLSKITTHTYVASVERYARYFKKSPQELGAEHVLATLSGFFGGLALLLAMIGPYGVTSYNVARRRNEIGIRIALGAQQSRVLSTVLSEVVMLIGIGLVLGLPITIAATHFIANLLYGVRANDPWTISVTADGTSKASL